MTFINGQTTGLGVAAQILVPGNNAPISTKRGYNNVTLSLSGAGGWPTTFQLQPVVADVVGTPYLQGATFTLSAVAASTPGSFALTAVAASVGGTAAYSGTFSSGGSNAYEGYTVTVTGFTGAAAVNNGTFQITASNTTTLTLNNPNAVAVTAAGTVAFLQGTAVYTGVINGGADNAYAGLTFGVSGFTAGVHNGTFIAVASTNTTITLENASATGATQSATLTSQEVLTPVANQLGGAAKYALLGNSGITNSGSSVIAGGNIGSSPTVSITGFPPGVLTPPSVVDNGNAGQAQTDLAAAITYYQGLTPTLSGLSTLSTEGNGSTASTFTPGVYVGAAGLTMATGIILDAQGNPNATFVFVAGSTINLASGQTVALVNGAQAANVVFVAGSSFTAVATSTVNGNILAVASITLGGGTLNGRALANTGAVTISTATAVTAPFQAVDVFGNELTYVAWPSRTVTGQTYIPSGTPTAVVTVSATGLLTAVARGAVEVEVSFPAFNNASGQTGAEPSGAVIPKNVYPNNPNAGLPMNKIYTSVNVEVVA